jgi:predicted ATPase
VHTGDRPLSQRSHNLPAQHTTIIGRDDDAARVGELVLRSSGRLVTLTGTGGCGKTRLALHVAAALVGNFADGVWLVSLASVRDASLIPNAIAAAVGCSERAGEPLAVTLLAHLAERELLLLLDNCEHLIEASATLVEHILDGCSYVRVLATSRERLRTTSEQTWRVASLAVPDPEGSAEPEGLLQYSAVRLFTERAQAVHPSFAFGRANARTVTSICARLEGLPLAIELAAARTGVLSLPEVLERLDDAFRLLVGGSRTAPNRQQTMHATLDWSYSLLAADERIVFERLVVFAGGWSVAAAETVCADQILPQQDVLELLGRLVDKSLVVASEQAGRSRFRLLEPIRQYAQARLLSSDEYAAAHARHARYFMDFAERLQTDANVGGPRRLAAQEELAQEQDNLRVALRWCIDNAEASMGLRLAEALTGLWIVRSMTNEARAWLSQALAVPGAAAPTLERAAVLIHLGFMANRQADYAQARTLLEEALPITRRGRNAWLLFCNLNDLAAALEHSGHFRAAQDYMEEALATTRAAGDQASEAHILNNLGFLAYLQADLVVARPSVEKGLALARALDDTWLA